MGPLLDALRALGGRAKPRECSDWIAENLKLPKETTEARTESGTERFHMNVMWARQYLMWEGLIDGSERGVWKLTPKGAKTHLSREQGQELFERRVEVHEKARQEKAKLGEAEEIKPRGAEPKPEAGPVAEEIKETADLLEVLQGLPPGGFERICKRILSEYGFENVIVTGKSRDGGIDGMGILRLNPFVTLKVMFQCKRYRGSVSRAQVGDFRNAMIGRAEKGIFITTGYFTGDAEKEANRDGAPPVELVDGDRLVELFQSKQLGLVRREAFDIDHSFFDQFR